MQAGLHLRFCEVEPVGHSAAFHCGDAKARLHLGLDNALSTSDRQIGSALRRLPSSVS